MEKNVSSEISIEALQKKEEVYLSKINKMKTERFIYNLMIIIIIIIVIFSFKTCSSNTIRVIHSHIEKENMLKNEIANLKNQLLNQKAILVVKDTVIGRKHGKFVSANIVNLKDNRPSNLFIKNTISYIPVPYPVLTPQNCPQVLCPKCPDIKIIKDTKIDSLLNDSLEICLDKQYRADSMKVLVLKKFQLRDMILNYPLMNFNNSYTEYVHNDYRLKSQNAFKRAIVSSLVSVGLYATSEAMGTPVFIDGRDNSNAKRTHNQIFWLRAGSAIFGAYGAFEFGRTIYFHNMEGKFIINPTTIGLTIYLDKKGKK